MTDYEIVQAMKAFGGSFAQAIGAAWQCADTRNQARLKAAFQPEWEKYRELAELQQKCEADR